MRMHPGNHNTELSAPLAILGIEYPRNIKSMSAWRQVFKQAKERIAQPATVDVIIQELGVDKPGDMAVFGRYLRPDIAVVTAVTPEHMEYFGTLDAVAAEELSVVNFSKVGVINRDDIPSKYANLLTNVSISTYGTTPQAEYSLKMATQAILPARNLVIDCVRMCMYLASIVYAQSVRLCA